MYTLLICTFLCYCFGFSDFFLENCKYSIYTYVYTADLLGFFVVVLVLVIFWKL